MNSEERISDESYRIVADELNAAVFEWNLKEGTFHSSKAYSNYAISKVKNEDILNNRGPIDIVHPDDRDSLQHFFKATEEGKEHVEAVLRVKMINGDFHWCRMIGFFYKDKQGNPERTLGIILDINEEHEKGFMLNNLINELPGGVGIFSLDKVFTCQYFSDGFAALCQRTREEVEEMFLSGSFWKKTIAPEDYEYLKSSILNCVKEDQSINLNFRYIMKDSQIAWLHLAAVKMMEESNRPIYYCIFTSPADETKLYRDIVEDSAHGVLVVECETRRIIYINKALIEIYESANKRMMNPTWQNYIIPDTDSLLDVVQIDMISEEKYSEYHVEKNGLYMGIRTKKVNWNGIDSFIFYFTDETIEHAHQMQLQDLIDHIPGGIGIFELYDGQAHQVYLNDSFYSLLHDKRENRIYGSDTEFFHNVHPTDIPVIHKAVSELIGGKEEMNFDYRTKNKEDSYIWLHLTAKVIKRIKNKVVIYCCFTDITESMDIKNELEKSSEIAKQQYEFEKRRRKVLERDSFASICIDITQNLVLSVSHHDDRFKGIKGEKVFHVIQREILRYIPDEEHKNAFCKMLDMNHIKNMFENGITEETLDYRSYQADGDLHWIRMISNTVKQFENDDIVIYVYFYDVDKNKKIQYASKLIADEEIEYAMLYSVKQDEAMFIHLTRPETIPELDEYFTFTDCRRSEYSRRINSEDLDKVHDFFSGEGLINKLSKGLPAILTFRRMSEQNTIQWKTVNAFYLDELKEDIVIVCRDITEIYKEEQHQKKVLKDAADEANRANHAKSEFLARMSHDMRTPMNGILGLAELSMDEKNINVMLNNNMQIIQAGKYLLSLINDTLDFQKIESGKMILDEKIVDTKQLIDGICELIEPMAEAKHINFVVDNRNLDMEWFIKLDSVRVTQIFTNLLSNAVKFTPEGGKVTLEIFNMGRTDMISHNRIRVIDTGTGMSQNFIREHLYKPFEQEKNEIETQYTGSGLGLSIVYNLIKMMGGSIEVESKLGIGTVFTVYLDFLRVDKSEVKAIMKEDKKAELDRNEKLRGKRILLVEDHPLNAQIAARLLKKAGCEVEWEENGEKGVKAFENSSQDYYDLILMDIRMPVMDGLKAAEKIRALSREDAGTIPIIAMTANAYDEDVQKSLQAGMNMHLVKPIDPEKMYTAIIQFMK